MENEEKDVLVVENQISFDFDSLKENNDEEESSILPASLLKSVNHEYIKEEVLFVVVKSFNDSLVKNLPYLKICGKSMLDWVLLAGSECEQKVIEDSENIIDKVREIKTEKPYIAVFYSDTPLLDKQSFNKLIDYFSSKNINFLQLSRGFIVKNEFLKNTTNIIQGVSSSEVDDKTLMKVDSAKKINYVSNLLFEKILAYHIKNGVIIFGQNTVFIDADVEIESGVVIYPNNVLEGETIVESGAVLRSGNIIRDSIIGCDSDIASSFIDKSKIGKGTLLEPFSKIINKEV